MKIQRQTRAGKSPWGPKKVANIVRRPRQQLRAPVEIGILLHIFGGKMSEKSVAVVVRSQVPREYREV